MDISPEQERAQELISETRLYRQTAATTGNASVTGILDELERVMLDIAHGPSRLSPVELEKLRARLEAEGILFKIRVVNSNVRSQEEASPGKAGGMLLAMDSHVIPFVVRRSGNTPFTESLWAIPRLGVQNAMQS